MGQRSLVPNLRNTQAPIPRTKAADKTQGKKKRKPR